MIPFYKYHGLGNDYVYIDARATGLDQWSDDRLAELARLVSDRQFAIGGDGMILIENAGAGRPGMRIFNADGSEAEMCGNGIRCVAKYLFDHGETAREVVLSTKAGPIGIDVRELDSAGKARTVRVDMGPPRFAPEEIPARLPARQVFVHGIGIQAVVGVPLTVNGCTFEATCVSMGNPHCVIYTPNLAQLDLREIGPALEHHPAFPARTNVEFVEQTGPRELYQRTWERGSAETLACGTGASATVVASILNGIVEDSATVYLPGGPLEIEWKPGNAVNDGQTVRDGKTVNESASVFMTGPASFAFHGEFDPADLFATRRPVSGSPKVTS